MTLLKAEEFYRYISDVPLPAVVTAAVLAGAGYQPACGFETLSRTAQVIFWLFAASLFFAACVQYRRHAHHKPGMADSPVERQCPQCCSGVFSFGGMDIVSDDGARRHGTAPGKVPAHIVKVFFSGPVYSL